MSRTIPSPSPVKLALGGALSLAAAMGIGRFVYTPILPFMVEGVPLSAEDAGLIAAANFLGYLIGALAGSMGHLPGSQRTWFLSALLVSAVTLAGMGLADGMTAFLILRFASGIASAFALVFSSALVLEQVAKANKPGLSALHFAGVGSGIALSAVLIATLGTWHVSWQTLWYASAVATVFLLAAIAFLIPRSATAEDHSAGSESEPQTRARKTPVGLILLDISYGLFGFGYIITATFISVIAREAPELQSAEAFVWLTVGLAGIPSILIWNRIAARIGTRQAIAVACTVEAVGVALSVAAPTPTLFLMAAALLGGTFIGISALGLVEASRLSPGNSRQALAIMTASFSLGQVIGPWVAGQLHTVTGDFQAASFAAAGALIAAALLVMIPTREPIVETGPRPAVPAWETLRAQLLQEGKVELVEAVETLRAQGGNVEAIRRLREDGHLDGRG